MEIEHNDRKPEKCWVDGKLLLQRHTPSGIFIDCEKKAGNNANGKKQPESTLPGNFIPTRQIFKKDDYNQCGRGLIGGGLQNLPQGSLNGSQQVVRQTQVKNNIDGSRQIKRYFFFGTLHMDTLETLYFPDTVIADDAHSSLFLFFDIVHILQPVERDEADLQAAGISDTFMDTRFCQVHTPAPLGSEKKRFLRLVHDIRERKDDYAAQLSALTIASLSATEKNREESRSSIISSLFGPPPQDLEKDRMEEAKQAELWQARLVLTIAEILDREDEELVEAMNILDKSRTDLFDHLLGKDEEFEEENPFSDLSHLQDMSPPRSGMSKNRLKAWLSLFRVAKLPPLWLWTTGQPEAADIMLEMYEMRSGKAAVPMLELELPAATGIELQDHMDKIEAFKEEAKPLVSKISKQFSSLVRMEAPPQTLFASGDKTWPTQWSNLLESHFPAELYGRSPFRLHLLPQQTFAQIAGMPSQNDGNDGPRHVILAVIG